MDLQPPEPVRRAGEPRHRPVPLSRGRTGAVAVFLARVLRLVSGIEKNAPRTRLRPDGGLAQSSRGVRSGAASVASGDAVLDGRALAAAGCRRGSPAEVH